jgi:crotonobetainyl-CoA:carnitine CoA-transferase CaiB-like acyl-CoA transferase
MLLREAWAALGGEEDLIELVTVRGDGEGLLPSTHAALPAMLAAVAASTLAASVLDAARGKRSPSPVFIDVEHVAVAARSERYARVRGSERASPFAPLSRFWRTADGWLRLHANYPWHRERALEVLGCEPVAEGVCEAVLSWRGAELEEALANADALGYAVRTAEAWQKHPQGAAVAALPLLDSVAGSGGGRELGADRAASGCRVLDLTRVIAGPVATRTMAAWGADVLRIDSPRLPEIPAQAVDVLPGKRSALLDFSDPSAHARLEQLLGLADVLVQGYRPGALARYGLAARDLAQRHPHLTTVTLSAWGPAGPWAARRGFDSLVQCPTGIADAEGVDGEPGVLPAQVLDHATGYLAAAAALLALAGVTAGEPPRSAQLSLAQTAHWLTRTGLADRKPQRHMRPDRLLVTLPGATAPVEVISPPGRVGDLAPSWSATTDFGTDEPRFKSTRPSH